MLVPGNGDEEGDGVGVGVGVGNGVGDDDIVVELHAVGLIAGADRLGDVLVDATLRSGVGEDRLRAVPQRRRRQLVVHPFL